MSVLKFCHKDSIMIISHWSKAVLVLKKQTFLNFQSRNIVIFSKFFDFVVFGTRDFGHND
jgi:hypothetical protein